MSAQEYGSHSHHGGHAHSHGHSHNHHGSVTVLAASVAGTLLLVVAEVAGGYAGHSLSLLSDAVHNLTDAPALMISWLAARWALRPPTSEKTFGYQRTGILAAFANALLLSAIALFLLYESAMRLRHPAPVQAGLMMWIAALALVVNGGITLALVGGRGDLNIRSVLVHSLGDAASSVGILAGALVIHWTGAVWVDPVLGLGIGVLVLWSATSILRESSHILLEGLPRHLQLEDVAGALLGVEGVQEVHDVHIWTLGTDSQALSCHVRIPDMHMEESEKIIERVQQVLEAKFHITHITVQLERAGLPKEAGLFMPEPLLPPDKG
jgi:cobalt-zinc-cadmium efflux system protein